MPTYPSDTVVKGIYVLRANGQTSFVNPCSLYFIDNVALQYGSSVVRNMMLGGEEEGKMAINPLYTVVTELSLLLLLWREMIYIPHFPD